MGTMTLSVRNGILALAFSVLAAITLAYGLLATVLVGREGWTAQVGSVNLLWLVAESGVALGVALTGFLLVRRTYRKSSAPEQFFFALFLASVAGESLLLWQAWLTFESYPSWFSGLLTRSIWAFRFAGLFFLFFGGLFAFGFPYRKYGNLVVASVATGIALAVLIPLHTASARNHVLYAMGDAPGVVLATSVLVVVTVGNYLVGAIRPGAVERAWPSATAALFFSVGWTLSIVMAPWGALAALPGIVVTAWKAEQTELGR